MTAITRIGTGVGNLGAIGEAILFAVAFVAPIAAFFQF